MTRRREISIAAAIVALYAVLAVSAPGFFTRENFSDLFLGNFPVLLAALGTTLVIVAGEIDISIGSVFAICGVVSGASAVAGVPLALNVALACAAGAVLGGANGALKRGVHVRDPGGNFSKAHVTMLRALGLETPSFGWNGGQTKQAFSELLA